MKQLHSLLLKPQNQPVIQDVLLRLPSAVPEHKCSNMKKNACIHFCSKAQLMCIFQLNRTNACVTLTLWIQGTHFIAHPFHFTRYSSLPWKKKTNVRITKTVHMRIDFFKKENNNNNIQTQVLSLLITNRIFLPLHQHGNKTPHAVNAQQHQICNATECTLAHFSPSYRRWLHFFHVSARVKSSYVL